MSIFGDIDVNEVTDDPFGIPAGTFWMVVTEAVVKYNEEKDKTSLVIKWTVNEEDSEAHNNSQSEWFTIYPGSKLEDLTPKERKSLGFLKRRLRRAFNMSESEMKSFTPDDLIGQGAFVTVKKSDKYTNVSDAVSKEVAEEENRDFGKAASSLGL